jgi:putative endonuclease
MTIGKRAWYDNDKIMKESYVYIMTNKSFTLYTGVTSNILSRVWQHRNKLVKGFTSKYNINKLVHLEQFNSISDAIAREKQIKGWTRKKKIELIKKDNPEFKDLGKEWGWY